MKKIYRSNSDKNIAGVCGGIGEYFGVSSKIFRILFLLTSILPVFGGGVVLYCILWILIPKSPVKKGRTKKHDNVIDVDVTVK